MSHPAERKARLAIEEMVIDFSDEIAKLTASRDMYHQEVARLQEDQARILDERDCAREEANILREALDNAQEPSATTAEHERTIAKLTAERDAARDDAAVWKAEADAWLENHPVRRLKEVEAERDAARAEAQELAEWKAWAEREMHRMIATEKSLNDRCAELYNQLHGLPDVTEPTIAAGTGPVAMPTTSLIESDLRTDTYRAGWQGVNEMPAGVRLTHLPTGTVIDCGDEPKRPANLRKAKRMMAERLGVDMPEKTGDLRGLQAKVSEHSRQIGALQDDVRALRDRLRKVEARPGRVLEDA